MEERGDILMRYFASFSSPNLLYVLIKLGPQFEVKLTEKIQEFMFLGGENITNNSGNSIKVRFSS